jgi:hypothetical protein
MANVSDIERMDFAAIGANIMTLSSNLPSISSSTKVVSSLLEQNQGEKLLEAAKALANATNDFLGSLQPFITGESENAPRARQEILTSGQYMARAGHHLLANLDELEVSPAVQQELVDLAKAVVQSVVAYVGHGAKPVAQEAAAQRATNIQQAIIADAKQSAAAAEMLVTITMVGIWYSIFFEFV